jgi:NmrA-like family
MKIVVIGGTGLIGSKLVKKLQEHGQETVPASPDSGVNTLTGEGLAEALEGAAVVVDVSNSRSFEDVEVLHFFETSTGNLLEAEAAEGVAHHVALSVVGTERLSESGYFRGKIAQEKLIQESSIPYSIVHATQFFEFVKGIADAATEGNTVARTRPVPAHGGRRRRGRGGPNRSGTAGKRHRRNRGPGTVPSRRAHPPTARCAERFTPGDHGSHARYFGAELSERTLVPGDGATLVATRFEDWLSRATAQ